MKSDKLVIIGALTLAAIILMIVLWIIAIIGAMDLTDGCLYRYNFEDDNSISSSSSLMNSVTLKANGNYTALSSDSSSGLALDPNTYGKWLNTNLRLNSDQKVDVLVKGEISLCKAYIPAYNLQKTTHLDKDGGLIEIPRVEDKGAAAINLIFDSRKDEWRNLTQLFKNDRIVVGIHPDKKSTAGASSVYNNFEKRVESADCTEGKRAYNPICGRYSIWNSGSSYTDKCRYVAECYECNHRRVCKGWDVWGWCVKGYKTVWDWCGCYENVSGTPPEPYQNDGKYTSPWVADVNVLSTSLVKDCRNNQTYVDGDWQNEKYFWFSADTATGLLYRFDANENPTNKKNRGGNFGYSKIDSDQSSLSPGADYRIIRDQIYTAKDVSYLQYRNHDGDGYFGDNTGGYVLNIKQTKCRRTNGNSFNDTFAGRGNVQYVIGSYGKNPNTDMSGVTIRNILLDANGSGSITAPSDEEGYLWFKINNDPNDYKDSFGQYRVDFTTTIDQGGFFHDVLDPFFQGFKDKIQGAAEQIFKNMTCYKGISGSGNCTNFFNYIKGLLSLYIMIYGMMFLIGMVQISQTDLVMRIIKIAFVAGLLNDTTFEFFNTYVFDFVTGFTDDIIANMAGYSIFSGSTTISNPFMFLNEVMTKIFLSSTFIAQIMALLSMGINGVLYFILIIVCLGIVVIVLLRSIAVYLMAFMAITVLIGLTPLFLTFILFERTFYLFDNWVKFTFRYMLEPVILLAGIIILTQLFTIYLDFVIGYSVCWKCAIPLKLPFPAIEGLTPAFLDVEIFCFNWFAPWGFDHRSSQMGLNMQNMIVLLMIVYCMWGYLDFSGNIVARLAGSAGGPSATGMGKSMSSAIEQKALSKVGLDQQGRAQIKSQAKERLKGMEKSNKRKPIDSGNRHDVKPPTGGGGKPGGVDSKAGVEKMDPKAAKNAAGGLSGGSSTGGVASGAAGGAALNAASSTSSSTGGSAGGASKWKSGASSAAKATTSGAKMGAHRSSSASVAAGSTGVGSSAKNLASNAAKRGGAHSSVGGGENAGNKGGFGSVKPSRGLGKSGVTMGKKPHSDSSKGAGAGESKGDVDKSGKKSKVQRSSLESTANTETNGSGSDGSNNEGSD